MEVPASLYWHSLLAQKSRPLWMALAGLETRVLGEELQGIEVRRPVYIAGLARSGSTILLEMLNELPEMCSHRYCDFPYLFTPYWTHWMQQRLGVEGEPKVERTHRDRIAVSQTSPEAMEEVLWMQFFPSLHRPGDNQVFDASLTNPDFERFYNSHICKLLLARGKARYLAKGNYNLGRLQYLLKLYPDARFVVPVRRPQDHIASLVKQQRLFKEGTDSNPRAGRYLGWVGHFEFGGVRRAMGMGGGALEIEAAWAQGEELRGWALTWRNAYSTILDQCASNPDLARRVHLVRYEDLCGRSEQVLRDLFDHCELERDELAGLRERYVAKLSLPDYYKHKFSAKDLAVIDAVCGQTAERLGY